MFNLELRYVMIDREDVEVLKKKVIECVGKENLDTHGDGGCVEIRNDIVFYATLERAKIDECRYVYIG